MYKNSNWYGCDLKNLKKVEFNSPSPHIFNKIITIYLFEAANFANIKLIKVLENILQNESKLLLVYSLFNYLFSIFLTILFLNYLLL